MLADPPGGPVVSLRAMGHNDGSTTGGCRRFLW
jgi:hypothetical protein